MLLSPMNSYPTPLHGCFEIVPQFYSDERGSFAETYNRERLASTLGQTQFIQDNEVVSKQGVIRGMHFQKGSFAQAKLIRVLSGSIIDIVVDLRPDSPTYLKQHRVELSADNHKQLFVPKGFAHGYSVCSSSATVLYKVDAPYAPEAEGGIAPLDPYFAFDWGLKKGEEIISERDLNWPLFHEE